jgi:hypothetical protein
MYMRLRRIIVGISIDQSTLICLNLLPPRRQCGARRTLLPAGALLPNTDQSPLPTARAHHTSDAEAGGGGVGVGAGSARLLHTDGRTSPRISCSSSLPPFLACSGLGPGRQLHPPPYGRGARRRRVTSLRQRSSKTSHDAGSATSSLV